MTVYLILIFVLLISGLGLKAGKSYQRRKLFLIFSFICMFIVSAFRAYTVGTDTRAYVAMFQNIDYLNFYALRFENGFLTFLRIIHSISDNPTLFLAISSAICIGTTCVFIHKYSEDPILAVLLYITLKQYFFQMTGIRQALATALVMIAFSIVMNDRTLKRIVLAALFIFLAMQFHNMSVVAFIPFILWVIPKSRTSNIINSRNVLKWTIILAIVVFIFYPYIMRLVGIISPQYAHYFSGRYGESNYFASLFKMLIQLAFLVVGSIYLRDEELSDTERLSLIMLCISVVVGTLSMRMEIWGRLTGMFSIYTAVLFGPAFSSKIKDGHNRVIVKSLVFLFSFAYMLVTFIFRPEWDGVVPFLFK